MDSALILQFGVLSEIACLRQLTVYPTLGVGATSGKPDISYGFGCGCVCLSSFSRRALHLQARKHAGVVPETPQSEQQVCSELSFRKTDFQTVVSNLPEVHGSVGLDVCTLLRLRSLFDTR